MSNNNLEKKPQKFRVNERYYKNGERKVYVNDKLIHTDKSGNNAFYREIVEDSLIFLENHQKLEDIKNGRGV